MEELYRKKQKELKRCIERKMFLQAADLEQEIELIVTDKERKRPFTRTILELQITEIQEKIQVAIDTKAYADCANLQTELDTLKYKRKELPSLKELKVMMHQVEDRVQCATKNRDFEGAETAQKELDLIIARYDKTKEEEELVNENFFIEEEHEIKSRAELDYKLLTLQTQVAELTSSKKIDEVSRVHQTIIFLEELKPKFPSLSHLKAIRTELQEGFNKAIALKDFSKAGDMQKEIDEADEKVKKETLDLEQYPAAIIKCEKEDGVKSCTIQNEMGTFEINSRSQLDEHIRATSHKVDVAASFKDFGKANFFNNCLKKFQLLSKVFPTSEELMRQLDDKKAEFNDAVSKKEFDAAAMLHKEVDALENDLAEWKEKEHCEENDNTSCEELHLKVMGLKEAYQIAINEKDYKKIGDIHVQIHAVQAAFSAIATKRSISSENSIELELCIADPSSKSYTIQTEEEIMNVATRQELDHLIQAATHQGAYQKCTTIFFKFLNF